MWKNQGGSSHFNPRSSWEERQFKASDIFIVANFNPRSSWEERLTTGIRTSGKKTFQSTLLVRGATGRACRPLCFQNRFQSTLLVRGATKQYNLSDIVLVHFNPRSSWEERRHACKQRQYLQHFNPRSSWEERPGAGGDSQKKQNHFNPRSSWEERPVMAIIEDLVACISIHAPRERSDVKLYLHGVFNFYFNPRSSWEERPFFSKMDLCIYYFNPRSSWEERPAHVILITLGRAFQSTLLVRGATKRGGTNKWLKAISIHAPRERSDYWAP